jgi:uncharacterized protein YcnI
MKKLIVAIASSITCLLAGGANAHNYLLETQAEAGHVKVVVMRVPHGCKGSPVIKVRIKIPDGMVRVTVDHTNDWDIDVKMREVNPPLIGLGGQVVTETIDQITWSNPKVALPPDRTGEFRFRGMMPNTPGEVIFFKTLNDCVEGTDYYVDLPEERLDLKADDFHEKFWAMMTATATPAPYLILTTPERPQYPWEWKTADDKPLPKD